MSFIIYLLKTRDLILIKRKLIALYMLNVTDIIFTILLVNTGMFLEGNTIMAPLVNNRQLLSILVKVVIPFVLLLWVYHRMKDATEKQLYQSNIIIICNHNWYLWILGRNCIRKVESKKHIFCKLNIKNIWSLYLRYSAIILSQKLL